VNAQPEGIRSEIGTAFSATVSLSAKFYNKDSLLKAAYWLSNRAVIYVPESDDEKFIVLIRLKQTTPSLESPRQPNIEELVDEFCNSIIDFELRHQVEIETAQVRQIILAKAFSESGVLEEDPPGSILDPVEQTNPSNLVNIANSSKK
jgi:His-Xaa-Ser system protein HxsD